MQAIGKLAERSKSDPFTEPQLTAALNRVKTRYGFTDLKATRVGEDWSVYARMNPDNRNNLVTLEGEMLSKEDLESLQITGTPGATRRATEIGNYVHRFAELMSREGLLTPPLPNRRLDPEHPFLGKHYLYNRTLRADRLDHRDRAIYEIKPVHRKSEGQAQVNFYVERANIELGGVWTGIVVTYDPVAAGNYLTQIGVFED